MWRKRGGRAGARAKDYGWPGSGEAAGAPADPCGSVSPPHPTRAAYILCLQNSISGAGAVRGSSLAPSRSVFTALWLSPVTWFPCQALLLRLRPQHLALPSTGTLWGTAGCLLSSPFVSATSRLQAMAAASFPALFGTEVNSMHINRTPNVGGGGWGGVCVAVTGAGDKNVKTEQSWSFSPRISQGRGLAPWNSLERGCTRRP